MSEAKTVPAKYIFLDIVGYTRNRSVEAQSDIVGALNNLVKQTIEAQKLKDDDVIYIPTGDGMCIALLGVTEPVDVHMQIALNLLSGVSKHNERSSDLMRKFEIRVGINENVDNLILDINERRNVAGAGISMAQRIMDTADANQILVGLSVFESLNQREKYMSKFRPYKTEVKHGQAIQVYQYVQGNLAWLNTKTPSRFVQQIQAEPKLTKFAAYYFAHDIKLRDIFISQRERVSESAMVQLLWFLARDSVEKSEATEIKPPYLALPNIKEGTVEEQLAFFDNLPVYLGAEIVVLVEQSPHLSKWLYKYFEGFAGASALFINSSGKEKLEKDWPDIWKELE